MGGGRIPAGEYQVLYITRETEQLVLLCVCLEKLKMVSEDSHIKGVGGKVLEGLEKVCKLRVIREMLVGTPIMWWSRLSVEDGSHRKTGDWQALNRKTGAEVNPGKYRFGTWESRRPTRTQACCRRF